LSNRTRWTEPLADRHAREGRGEAVDVPATVAGIAEHHLIFPVGATAPVARPLLWYCHEGRQFGALRICTGWDFTAVNSACI
jgi:hypothetical protein